MKTSSDPELGTLEYIYTQSLSFLAGEYFAG